MKTFKLRHEVQDIPDTENGVYWFKLRFPTAYSMGIKTMASEESLSQLVETIQKFSQVINNININTSISSKKRLMLLDSLKLSLQSEPLNSQNLKLASIFKDKSIIQLQSIIQLVQLAVNELPPIYVGMTEKQSFRERFNQHFSGESNFLDGLNCLGLNWDCLNYVVFPQNTYDISYHRDLEQVFHYMFKPILSKG